MLGPNEIESWKKTFFGIVSLIWRNNLYWWFWLCKVNDNAKPDSAMSMTPKSFVVSIFPRSRSSGSSCTVHNCKNTSTIIYKDRYSTVWYAWSGGGGLYGGGLYGGWNAAGSFPAPPPSGLFFGYWWEKIGENPARHLPHHTVLYTVSVFLLKDIRE